MFEKYTECLNNGLFRYRGIHVADKKTILDEIKNEEIFFGSPKENNDPVEGISNLYFKGDRIIWMNLFEHYLFHLFRIFGMAIVGSCELKKEEICVRETPYLYEQLPVYKRYKEMCSDVFKDENFLSLFKFLEDEKFLSLFNFFKKNKKIYKKELFFIFQQFHIISCYYLFSSLLSLYGNEDPKQQKSKHYQFIKNEKFYLKETIEFLAKKRFFEPMVFDKPSIEIIEFGSNTLRNSFLNVPFQKGSEDEKNYLFYMCFFPMFYLDSLEEMLFPQYRLASFSLVNDDLKLWSDYAEGHKGVCCIFAPEIIGDKNYLHIKEYGNVELHNIKYKKKLQSDNFFKINRWFFPGNKFWLFDQENNNPTKMISIYRNHGVFLKKLEKRIIERMTTKFEDYKLEQEVRIIRECDPFLSTQINGKVLHFDFKQLKGIIFGINTPFEIKKKIYKIVKSKIQKDDSENFKFYTATWSPQKNKIIILPDMYPHLMESI